MRRKFLLMLGVALIAKCRSNPPRPMSLKLILACIRRNLTRGNDCTDTSKGCLYCCSSCAEYSEVATMKKSQLSVMLYRVLTLPPWSAPESWSGATHILAVV